MWISRAGTKKPRQAAVSLWARSLALQRADVRGLQALLALLDFEFDALVFRQRLEAVALNVTEVGEQVGAAGVLSNEAVAFALVEPLHGTGLSRHGRFLSFKQSNAQHMLRMQRHSRNVIRGFPTEPFRNRSSRAADHSQLQVLGIPVGRTI